MAAIGLDIKTGSPVSARRDLAELRELTGKIVGSQFFGTLLKTMRDSNLKGAYGHGGRGEQVFAAQLDGLIAERLGTASQRGLADELYRRLERQQRLIGRGAQAVEGESP